jgi:hypothetical protein
VEREFGVPREGRGRRDRWRVLKRESEIKEHEMRLLEEQLLGSNPVLVRFPFIVCKILRIDFVLFTWC